MNLHLEPANIISLVALEVGILAAFFGLLVAFINTYLAGRVSKLEDAIIMKERGDFFLTKVAENSGELFVLLDTVIVSQHLLIVRLLRGERTTPSILTSYQKDFIASRRRSNKFMQTLLIYSSRKDWRQSAFKQLSEDLGDAETLRAFLELEKYERDLCDDLRRATVDLEERLNECVHQATLSREN